MKLKIGEHEAIRLRERMSELNLTQKQIATQLGISERYLREILAKQKTKPLGVDQEKMEEFLAILGIGYAHICPAPSEQTIKPHPQLDSYVKKLKSKMYSLLSKDTEEVHNQQLAQFLQEDKAVNKTMGFWYTLIVKTISDKYKVMRHFFSENDFFTIIPSNGYWRRFRHNSKQQKNCYFSFKITPSHPISLFKIAYTLESPIVINSLIPKKIKIFFGQIECSPDYTRVIQFHDTPASYKIYSTKEIIITTWLDEADHDFIIYCEHDFALEIVSNSINEKYPLGIKTKRQVRDMFHQLDTVLFPRNHLFHRSGRHDMGDDPIFFWDNKNFLSFNADLLETLLDENSSA